VQKWNVTLSFTTTLRHTAFRIRETALGFLLSQPQIPPLCNWDDSSLFQAHTGRISTALSHSAAPNTATLSTITNLTVPTPRLSALGDKGPLLKRTYRTTLFRNTLIPTLSPQFYHVLIFSHADVTE
jgi:hypothetical protein